MPRILVIDDDDLARFTVCQYLQTAGYETCEAENGDIGLRLQREKEFDLVITDIYMPVREGIETLRALRSEAPKMPVIVISGGGSSTALDSYSSLEAARRFGAYACLRKPFTKEQLIEVVETCV